MSLLTVVSEGGGSVCICVCLGGGGGRCSDYQPETQCLDKDLCVSECKRRRGV